MPTGAIEDIANELKLQYPSGTFKEPVNKKAKYRKSLNNVDLVVREGGTAQVPLGIAAAWNVGSIADDGAFPTPIDPLREQGSVSPELFVGSFKIGVKTKALAKSQKSTFNAGGIMADRVEGTVNDLGSYINRVYAGSNRGRLAVVLSVSANKFVCDAPMMSLLLARQMRIDAYDALSAGALRSDDGGGADTLRNRKITGVNRTTHEVTYDGSDIAALTTGDHIFMTGTYGRTHYSLRDIVDDGTECATIYGKSRTTYPELQSIVKRGSDGMRDVSEQLVLDILAETARESEDVPITQALCNDGQARKYVEFVQAERRYPGPTGSAPKYTIGYDEGSLQIIAPGVNVKLEVDKDIPPRRIYFLAKETFGLFEAMSMDWIDEDALLHLAPTAGGHTASFLAYIGSLENQINTMPRANAMLGDLNDPICGDGSNPV